MITLDVGPGVHRVERASTCCYLVEHDAGAVLVDGGLPRFRGQVDGLLASRGLAWADVDAIVLTHAHFDHLGVCAEAEERHGTTTWVHADDERIARHPYRYRPGRPRLLYPLTRARSLPHLGAMVAAGALGVRGVTGPRTFDGSPGEALPGGLVAVRTPGHTDGHVAFHLPDRGVVLTGDALVTLDPYTGLRGPRVVARAGTKDRARAVASLPAIAATGARIVLPGHGDPFHGGAAAAAHLAEVAGAA